MMLRTCAALLCCLACTLGYAQDLESGYGALRRGDLQAAMAAFATAAEAGSAEAQHQLGKLYLLRAGDGEDRASGLRWLEQAADAGETGAQYTLGLHLVEHGQRIEGERWLQRAAAGGSTQAARYLEVAAQNEPGLTSTELAARWRSAGKGCNAQELAELLEAGADIDITDNQGRTALHHLVECDDARGVELLLRHGADTNRSDRYGETALSRAVARENATIVARLVAAGADATGTNQAGSTLVHEAVHRNALSTLSALLAGRPALDRVDAQGYTALDRAIQQDRQEAARLLRASGARRGKRLDTGAGQDIASHLVSGGTDTWDTARQAAQQDAKRALEILLEHGGDNLVTAVDDSGYSLLMYAAQANAPAALALLLEHGADADLVNAEGLGALMLAARNGHAQIMLHLLHSGADPLLTDKAGRDAIMHALLSDHDGIANTLLVEATPQSPERLAEYLRLAIARGASTSAAWLAARDTNTDVADAAGRAPLWYSAKHCDETVARTLLQRGADVRRVDRKGQNALHIAARENCPAVVALLLDNGAAIDGRSQLGNTPLLLAATHGATSSALLLTHRGADTRLANSVGETALMYAVRGDNRALISALLEQGADPYRRNDLGDSALTLAQARDPAVLELLRARSPFRLPLLD